MKKRNIKAAFLAALAVLCLLGCGVFKKGSHSAAVGTTNKLVANRSTADTAKSTLTAPPAKGPKKFGALITSKAKADSGLFNVYLQEDKYFLELPDSLLNRDILLVSRIARSSAEVRSPQPMLGYGGDEINEHVIRFDKGPGGKLFLRLISYAERGGDSTATMYRSVLNSNVQPIAASFEIKALSKKENGVVVELTELLNGDNDLLFFDPGAKQALRLAAYQPDKSYVREVKAYPNNVEIKTLKTYLKAPAGPNSPGGGYATYELNTSIVLLPAVQMHTRSSDDRVGYFTVNYTDFDSNPQGVDKVSLITRWRLEPKVSDRAKYLAGELVEPAKPIIYYIDPATPKKWVPYLIQGVNDWNVAFEKAGFKNAIIAKEAPVNDPSWSLEDARHNAIVYKPSDISNAAGVHVHDPRTGEILETHINWYHNIMNLLHNWYMIQAGAIDPKARQMQFDDELMGQLIRFVSSHEVGHTLGLRHNFGASSTVPVEKLRDKAWLDAHGHTPSIMDYARFNYVAQPEDGLTEKDIFPRIGDYDLFAIEWAYRWHPKEGKAVEKKRLDQWVISQTEKNKALWFGNEKDADDPRDQSEDLGDDAMKAGAYGIKNLKRIAPQLLNWTKTPDDDYTNAGDLFAELQTQFNRYMEHAAKNIGGIMTSPKTAEQPGNVVSYVPKVKQQEAMFFLQQQLFTTPEWLINKQMFDKTGRGSIVTIAKQQDMILNKLLSFPTLYKLLQFEGFDPVHAYTAGAMLNELQSGIFSELSTGKPITIYRRNLQKSYTEKLMVLLTPPPVPPGMMAVGPEVKTTDMMSLIKMQLRELQIKIRIALPHIKERTGKAHLLDLNERITAYFKNTRS